MTTEIIPLQELTIATDIGTLTSVSWEPPKDGLAYEQWESIGYTLQRMDGSIAWWLGDFLNYGEHTYGEKYAQVVEATGWAVQRLKDYCWVAANVDKSLRNDKLSWTHHRHVAHLDTMSQKHYLGLAARNGWSTAQLRHVVKAESYGSVAENGPHTALGTPLDVIYDAHTLMGGIDLDPASSEAFNTSVKASMIYTKSNDGLAKPWFGRVFLHPPSGWRDGYENAELWVSRMVAAWEGETFHEGLLLIPAITGADWFQRVWDRPLCFMGYRMKFVTEDGETVDAPHHMAVAYFGNNVAGFANVFRKHGAVVRRFA